MKFFVGKIDSLAPKKRGGSGNLVCMECKSTFVSLSCLRLHTKKKHPGKKN